MSKSSTFSDDSSEETSPDNKFSNASYPSGPPHSDDFNDIKNQNGANYKSTYTFSWCKPADALKLTGILNALDGVVDCLGRIIIMTSNHPEKVDKALIRPGPLFGEDAGSECRGDVGALLSD